MATKKEIAEKVEKDTVLRINILSDLSAVVTDHKGKPVEYKVDKHGGPPGVSITGALPAAVWGDGNSICVWHHGRRY